MKLPSENGYPRQRKVYYPPHSSSQARMRLDRLLTTTTRYPFPNELDTDYVQRMSGFQHEEKQLDTWRGIRKNTWQHGHHGHQLSSYDTGNHPEARRVSQLAFSMPRDNGVGGKEVFHLEPIPDNTTGGYFVRVSSIPVGRGINPLLSLKGFVDYDENGKLTCDQGRSPINDLFGPINDLFGRPASRTKQQRQRLNRVVGDGSRAIRDYLHNKKADELNAARS
jgi:hypothetical protein